MRQPIAFMVITSLLLALPVLGSAKGCLKGAAVGGVVGHVAGHHAVVGAAAGCVIEHHREKVQEKQAIKNEKKETGKSV
jgi:outer membrane lipoprotein SlyB